MPRTPLLLLLPLALWSIVFARGGDQYWSHRGLRFMEGGKYIWTEERGWMYVHGDIYGGGGGSLPCVFPFRTAAGRPLVTEGCTKEASPWCATTTTAGTEVYSQYKYCYTWDLCKVLDLETETPSGRPCAYPQTVGGHTIKEGQCMYHQSPEPGKPWCWLGKDRGSAKKKPEDEGTKWDFCGCASGPAGLAAAGGGRKLDQHQEVEYHYHYYDQGK